LAEGETDGPPMTGKAESARHDPPGHRDEQPPDGLSVASIESALFRVPLKRPVAGSSARPGATPRPLSSWDVIAVRIRAENGVEGLGLTYELRAGGEAVLAALRHDLEPLVLGADCWATERIWERLYWATYNAGRRGTYIHALSALDIALWDAKACACGVSLARMLGADRRSVPLYESDSGWLSLSLKELVRENARAAERGLRAVKIMVGAPEPGEDERRVAAVRDAIGSDLLLMVDAGQKWDLRTALDRIHRLEEHDVFWVEEPLSCDDLAGHERLAAAVRPRIATGQTLTTRFDVRALLKQRAVDVLQMDVARIGGVTEWWRAAHLADADGVQLAPHFLMELHVGLVAASPRGLFVEHTPWLSYLLEDPPEICEGELLVPEAPGHGLRLRSDLDGFRVA
jgi:L-talarate/galactarate dehydratase